MNDTTHEGARSALDSIDSAQHAMAGEIGLPRWYWWMMAAGWIVLGVLGDLTPGWVAIVATVLFGAGNATLAGRLYDGTRGTAGVRLNRSQVSRRLPWLIIGILVVLVLPTIGVALGLDADGAGHPGLLASVFVAAIVGFGGPEILQRLRRLVHA
ncbi:hypothetical protein [Gordonia sp. FQ]|uniref:hypothetical protein n=1 Tax=Gordonia sp. FQ TaxID=3446634 RepID=UPI003F8417F5